MMDAMERVANHRSPLVRQALAFAASAHHGARREGDTTIDHPARVACIVEDAGFDAETVAAALLHDVVEDTDTGLEELRQRFGRRVALLVDALSEDESIDDYEERKAAHREKVGGAGRDAAAVFAADKLANARDLRERSEQPPAAKLEHYRSTLEMVEDAHPDIPFLPQLREELAGLEPVRAESRGPA